MNLEKIQYYYNDYLYNLLKIQKIFKLKWINPKNVITSNTSSSWKKCSNWDPFIKDSLENKTKLAKNILENGTYWALTATKINEKYLCYHGNHRLDSFKELLDKGLWNGKLPFLIIPPNCYRLKNHIEIGLVQKLDTPITLRLPKEMKNDCFNAYYEIIEDIDKHTLEVKVFTKIEALAIYMTHTTLLRNPIHNYLKSGKLFKGNLDVNKEEILYNEDKK